jgi:cyclopropane-fatty-acyl-phospholipid synthase
MADEKQIEYLGASQEAVSYHYDLSNDFYSLWLDPTMTYTSALFRSGDESLRQAQEQKIDYFAEKLGLGATHSVLDIGSGWGGFLKYLSASGRLANGTGLTLAQAQASYCKDLGDPRLTFLIQNWADYRNPEAFDAIVSIESMEAFARYDLSPEQKLEIYRRFFQTCHGLLKPKGRLGIQVITYGNAGKEDMDEFIRQEIFPESDLPYAHELLQCSERQFEILSVENDRLNYAKTLRFWQKSLRANEAKATELVGARNVKKYKDYLRLSEFMFKEGRCDLLRLVFEKRSQPRFAKGT